MKRRIASLGMLSLFVMAAFVSAIPVSGAPSLVDTLTPLPSETIQPTLTPFVPAMCQSTSVIPTSPPFYTPTEVLPTVTGTVFPTSSPTVTPTSTPYGEGGGCDVLGIGQPVASNVQLGVNPPTVSVTGGCYAVLATGYCDFTVTFQRNSNFWGGNTGVTVSIPVYDLIPSAAVTMYYHETDVYNWSGGTLEDIVRIGFTDSPSCPVGFDSGLGGDGSCIARTNLASPAVLVYCGGQGVLDVNQSCHVTFDITFGSLSCFGMATPTGTPVCSLSGNVQPSQMIAYFNPPTTTLLGCYNIFNPITVPLPSLSWSPFSMPESLSFPGWQLCIQLLSFAAVFAGVDWALIAGGFLTLFAVSGIYRVIANQT